jgi:hypothetical protein
MGGYIGPTAHGAITGPTPGRVVCILGWVILILLVIFLPPVLGRGGARPAFRKS